MRIGNVESVVKEIAAIITSLWELET